MTVAEWLAAAQADARRRALPELVPALDALARAAEALRAADWNDDASGPAPGDEDAAGRDSGVGSPR